LRWSWFPNAFYGSKVIKGRWFEAATPACAWDCAFPPISCIPSFVRRLARRKAKTCFAPPPAPPGKSGPNSAIPAGPSATVAEGLGTARFTKPLELKKRRSARCPRVAALVQRHPPKPPAARPGQLAAHIALGITWGGLVGDRGHRKGQLRVLGS
jgi:hypothetical protein